VNPRYPSVAERAGHRCEYCGAPQSVFNFPFEVEHIRPLRQGGADTPDNLALACRSCNSHKGARMEALDPITNGTAPLFDPRRDAWNIHFDVDLESGRLAGSTATGRATIAALEMNSDWQIGSRLIWIDLGLIG
jgi:hypothetical protein